MGSAIRDFWTAFSNWRLVIWLALPQVLSQSTRGSKLLLIIRIFEPLIFIAVLYVARALFRMKEPNYGTSLFLFYASGFMPYYLFLRISTLTRTARTGRGILLPSANSMDVYLATVLFEALLYLSITVLLFYGMWLWGIDQARPVSIVDCVLPISLLIVLATGMGMIVSVVGHFLPLWVFIYKVCTRGLIFLSGVIFIVDLLPIWFRDVVALNPLAHAIDWFRVGIYGRYPHNFLDKSYLIEWAFISLFLGFVLQRAFARTMDRR
jgi:capsular polysaccharide transport system permease protein